MAKESVKEEWRDIPGHENVYRVSSFGNVKSLLFGRDLILKPWDDDRGYLVVSLGTNNRKIHDIVAEVFHGYVSDGTMDLVIDHENGIRHDNRAVNIKIITQRKNTSKDQKGSSEFPGVHWHKRDKKWQSNIRIDGKKVYLGSFHSEIEASVAYQDKLESISNG